MTLSPADVLEQVRRVAERCAERSHVAATRAHAVVGTGVPRGQRARQAAGVAVAVTSKPGRRRLARKGAAALPGPAGLAAKAIVHRKEIRHSVLRPLLVMLLVFALTVWAAWEYLVPGWVKGGLGWIIPGSCAAQQDAPGIRAAAHDLGAGLRSAAEWEPNREDIRGAVQGAVEGARELVEQVRRGLDGEPPPPPSVAGPPVQQAAGCAPCPDVQGARNSAQTIAAAVLAAGWTGEDAVTAVAISGAESGWRLDADNPTSSAYGPFQILTATHNISRADAADPITASRFAKGLYDARGWQPWEAYNTGAHLQFMDEARAAVQRASVPCEQGDVRNAADESDLAPEVLPARRAVLATFGPMTVHGWGTRPNPTEHDEMRDGQRASLALDFMASGERGQAIADYLVAHADTLAVDYLIWDRRIWDADRGWRPYRGASPHTDHVHYSAKRGRQA